MAKKERLTWRRRFGKYAYLHKINIECRLSAHAVNLPSIFTNLLHIMEKHIDKVLWCLCSFQCSWRLSCGSAEMATLHEYFHQVQNVQPSPILQDFNLSPNVNECHYFILLLKAMDSFDTHGQEDSEELSSWLSEEEFRSTHAMHNFYGEPPRHFVHLNCSGCMLIKRFLCVPDDSFSSFLKRR